MPSQATVSFEVTSLVHASNDVVWGVLGDFGREHVWTRSLAHCERDTRKVAIGTRRICTLPQPLMGRSKVSEELTAFEHGVELAYLLDGEAGPFRTASSRWRTEPDSPTATRVTVTGSFTPRNAFARFVLWPLARPMIQRLTRSVLAELDTFIQQQAVRNG